MAQCSGSVSAEVWVPLVLRVVQGAEGSSVAELQDRLQLWLGFSHWPGNFHVLWAQPEKGKRLSIVKMSVFNSVNNRFNAVPVKVLAGGLQTSVS